MGNVINFDDYRAKKCWNDTSKFLCSFDSIIKDMTVWEDHLICLLENGEIWVVGPDGTKEKLIV